jgi:hypothetical protein
MNDETPPALDPLFAASVRVDSGPRPPNVVPFVPRRPLPALEREIRAKRHLGERSDECTGIVDVRAPYGDDRGAHDRSDPEDSEEDASPHSSDPAYLVSPELWVPFEPDEAFLKPAHPLIVEPRWRFRGERNVISFEWAYSPGATSHLFLTETQVQGGRILYTARGTDECRALALTAGPSDFDIARRFLHWLFRKNGQDFDWTLFLGVPTSGVLATKVSQLFLVDIFWAAIDAAEEQFGEVWEGLTHVVKDFTMEEWSDEFGPAHDELNLDGSLNTRAKELLVRRYLDKVLL